MNSHNTKQAKILIVDDMLSNISILVEYLNEKGFKTLIAENGEIAIKRAKIARPDLILLDVMMPGIDGFEACRFLKENEITKDIPIIFITALSATENKIEGFKSGAVDYITKPFQHEEVLARVTTHLTIQRQKKELEQLNKMKDTLFSIIAHDLRGAFTPLVGNAGILNRIIQDINDNKIKNISNRIVSSVKNVNNLLVNLLDWGKIQRKNIKINKRKIDLEPIAKQTLDLLKMVAKDKGIEISHSIKPCTYVYADSNMIEAIIRNIASNAVKFTKNGGTISISALIKDEFIEVSITDTGIGISKEIINNLFRLEKETKRKGTAGEQGTGLGLYLCKDFVEKNNGNIFVESNIGKGTRFYFTIPKYKDSE